ncbi:MAG: endopeptidase La [Candidatus Poribacteria bacterium]|jgi:ATP-dependent Lon protease|nr:endopeptidase La [Candidatus Poribacteria bacterium]MDP6996511.1 endopeptidase La [Candidatus Poribacteria bacterium]
MSEYDLENNDSQVTRFDISNELPIIPVIGDLVVFPFMPPVPPFSPHHVALSGENVSAAVEHAMVNEQRFLCLFRQTVEKEPKHLGTEDLSPVGSLVHIVRYKKDEENVLFLAQGKARVVIDEVLHTDPFLKGRVRLIEDEVPSDFEGVESEALTRSAVDIFSQIVSISTRYQEEFAIIADNIDHPGRLADYIAAVISLKTEDKQRILELINVKDRFDELVKMLSKELNLVELESKIQSDAEAEINQSQKEYFLREQIRAIQKELGDTEDLSVEIDEYRDQIKKLNLPEKAQESAGRELKRLSQMQSFSPEATVCRNYLDWMVNLPWDKETKDNLDIDHAQQVLDEDHYNLVKVKDRILEYLAVRSLKTDMKGPILCFVGPPGVGKTSLGQSIARSMGREFVRISLGGVHDEAEIRGHRRTYIGSMPGRIIKSLRQAESNNPIFMLDELDKLGSDFRGDPASALLEVLDPEQNHSFVDSYIDVPFDLSKVMFIATANQLDPVSPPLRDRMEILELPGYTLKEKSMIAKQYLVPRQLEANGIVDKNLQIEDKAIENVINSYTREAGLRNLERELGTICRKVARQFAQGRKRKVKVSESQVETYLGPVKFYPEMAEREGDVGVVTGLSVTPYGGEVLFVECTRMKGEGKMTITGQVGDVMQESAQAAMSYIKSQSESLSVTPEFFKENDFHVHVPAGATPKDGPSAGITIATALASLATDRMVSNEVAMTGEISLRGRVLPIGGLKEKVLAAKQAGIKMIIAPEKNRKDLTEIPKEAQRGVNFVFVDHVDQVWENSFQN